MPIVDIELVAGSQRLRAETTQGLAKAVGQALGADDRTWVRVRYLPADQYAESSGQAFEVFPVFVSVLRRCAPINDDLEWEVEAITAAIGRVLEHPPENVHVLYEPNAKDRLAFGGKLVR